MTENTQPGGGNTANGDRQAALLEYNKQRQNLKELLAKRKQQDRQLVNRVFPTFHLFINFSRLMISNITY